MWKPFCPPRPEPLERFYVQRRWNGFLAFQRLLSRLHLRLRRSGHLVFGGRFVNSGVCRTDLNSAEMIATSDTVCIRRCTLDGGSEA